MTEVSAYGDVLDSAITEEERQLAEDWYLAYSDIKNPAKNAVNPAFRSGYANLEAVLDVVRPMLLAHNLTLVQETTADGDHHGVWTHIDHRNGCMKDLGLCLLKVQRDDPQGAGSAISYAKRYALLSIFGLAQEDDDGNAASVQDVKPATTKSTPKSSKLASKARIAAITGHMRELGYGREDLIIACITALGSERAEALATHEKIADQLTDAEAKRLDEHLIGLLEESKPSMEQVAEQLVTS